MAKRPARSAASPKSSKRKSSDKLPKQAVVIVHGMGEQRPMETIRSFVHTVWSQATELTPRFNPHVRVTDPETGEQTNVSWITPDARTGTFELRRITTPQDINGRRTDFYELYWSDVTQGTTMERLQAFVLGLLWRRWRDVPADVRALYIFLWLVTLIFALPAILAAALPILGCPSFLGLSAAAWAGIAAIMAAVLAIVLKYLGDVAIYVQAFPGTIAKRKEARERGLELMSGLMDDKEYDRIVLVAHSLGTILAYDLLQLLWSKYAPSRKRPRADPAILAAFRAVGKMALHTDAKIRAKEAFSSSDLSRFRSLQWKTYQQLRWVPDPADGEEEDPETAPRPWKISDFVTFGSPLTHAEFLLTHNKADFDEAVEDRLYATCPPVFDRENKDKERTILIPTKEQVHPHHAAVFAATRWTNIYDKGNGVITGDPVSGPLTENFGPGIENIRVRLRWTLGRIFTHTTYWDADVQGEEIVDGKPTGRSHLDVMRYAVDLARREESKDAATPGVVV